MKGFELRPPVFRLLLSCAAALLCSAGPAVLHAQYTVSGVVTDASSPRTSIAGATVRMNGQPPYTTDREGGFVFNRIAPARYTLSVDVVGYRARTIDVDVRSDTALRIELEPAPVTLDSLVVRGGFVTIRGTLRDAATREPLMDAQVFMYPGSRRIGAINGSFTIRNVPRGDSVSILAEAMERLPGSVTFTAGRDTSINIDLKIDPIAQRMIAQQVVRLDRRANSIPYAKRGMGRQDFERQPSGTIAEFLRRTLSPSAVSTTAPYLPISPCIFLDDQRIEADELLGQVPDMIERVEIYGGTRARMIRVYTKRYVSTLMRHERLPTIKLVDQGMSIVCT